MIVRNSPFNTQFALATIAVMLALPSVAFAGFDGSQLNLFVPFSLIIPATGFTIILLAQSIRNVNGFLRGLGHLLLMVGVLIYLFYSYLYFGQFPKMDSVAIRFVFAIPPLVGILQARAYIKSGKEYVGLNRTAVAAFVVCVVVPASYFTAIVFGNSFSKPSNRTSHTQSSDVMDQRVAPTDRDRRIGRKLPLPLPPTSPSIDFPRTGEIELTVGKRTVSSKTRDADR